MNRKQTWHKISYLFWAIILVIAFLPCMGNISANAGQRAKTMTADAVQNLAISRSDDMQYDVMAKVMPYYIEAYYLDKKIRIEQRAYNYLETVRKQAYESYVLKGENAEAYQSIEEAFEGMKTAVADDLKRQNKVADALLTYTDLDLTDYLLENPHVDVSLNRDVLKSLISYRGIVQSGDGDVVVRMEETYEAYLQANKALDASKKSLLSNEKKQIAGQKKRVTGSISEVAYAQICIAVYESSIAVISNHMELETNVWALNSMSLGALFDGQAMTEGNLITETGHYYIADSADGVLKEISIWISSEDTSIDAYELWIDGEKAGTALAENQTISVLSGVTAGAKKAYVRLYHGEEFLCDCALDLSKQSGELTLRYPKKTRE